MVRIPAPLNPAPSVAVVLQLRTIGVEYRSTHYSIYWKEWQHHIVITTERGHQRTLIKNDQGIAALLERGAAGVMDGGR